MPDEPSAVLPHASAVPFTLSGGETITIPPVTIGQARRALALHPADKLAETLLQRMDRIVAELNILTGPALDGLANEMTAFDARDLIAHLWFVACGVEPAEPAPLPVRHSPLQRSLPAEEMLRRVNGVASELREEFFPCSRRIEDVPLADALLLFHSLHPSTPDGN